jgi:hypothetical protein
VIVRIISVGATLCLALLAAACEKADESASRPRPVRVDEQRAEYKAIRLGDSRREVQARFGEPAEFDPEAGVTPLGTDWYEIGGPPVISPPSPREGDRDYALRYDRVTFFAIRGRVHGFVTADRGATTLRGVGVGDPLDAVHDSYPAATCETATDAHDVDEYDYCSVRLGTNRYLYFGQDPIGSIAMAQRPFR